MNIEYKHEYDEKKELDMEIAANQKKLRKLTNTANARRSAGSR